MEKVRVSQKEFETICAIVKDECTGIRMSEDFESMAKDFYYEDKSDEELMNARGYDWNCNIDKFANTYKQYMRNEYGDRLYRFNVIGDKNKVVKTVYAFDGDGDIYDILDEIKNNAKETVIQPKEYIEQGGKTTSDDKEDLVKPENLSKGNKEK